MTDGSVVMFKDVDGRGKVKGDTLVYTDTNTAEETDVQTQIDSKQDTIDGTNKLDGNNVAYDAETRIVEKIDENYSIQQLVKSWQLTKPM
mmetsp:Transcript_22778/g.29537  ORF Transcript_22778/g.29537 Transcript_22778/m.29537 type:complete len:90 (-) Transcript_22778:95-364(-)